MSIKDQRSFDLAYSYFSSVPIPTPVFDLHVGWSHSYEDLFRGKHVSVTAIGDLIAGALSTGRLMLCGKGGSGKTTTMHRLGIQALEAGILPLFIDLHRWSAEDDQKWNQLTPEIDRSIDYILHKFSNPNFSSAVLDTLDLGTPRLLLFDGLNELASNVAARIIEAVDAYVRLAVKTSVIVSDRMIRREFRDPHRWKLAVVMPLDTSEMRKYLNTETKTVPRIDMNDVMTTSLLSTPYFLDQVLKTSGDSQTRAAALTMYFSKHVSLTGSELDSTSKAAFRAYEQNTARAFSIDDFRTLAGERATKKLLDAEALIIDDGMAYFDHHLKHDYLASRYLARSGENAWTSSTFNALTFYASSFDALSLALEQITIVETADVFVRHLYDWNPYAAAYAVTDLESGRAASISAEMETVLLAMLAERRWDIVKASARRATDALSLFSPEKADTFLNSKHLEDIFEQLRSVPSSREWFRFWLQLFTRQPGAAIEDDLLQLILDSDSVLGWTVANLLKRSFVTESQQESLRRFLTRSSPTIRWRVVHVLGFFPTEINVKTLLSVLADEQDGWVRYGAVRSLIEMAARTDEQLRKLIVSSLLDFVDKLMDDQKTIEELGRVIFIDPHQAPLDWGIVIAPFIEAIYERAVSLEKRRQWEQIGYRFWTEYLKPQFSSPGR